MRTGTVLGLIVLTGCSLRLSYFEDDTADDAVDARPFVDARIPGVDAAVDFPGCTSAIATCEDGVVTLSESELPGQSCDQLDPPVVFATCAGECTTDYRDVCLYPDCSTPDDMCTDPPAEPLPPVLDCAPATVCNGAGTETCGGLDACGAPLITGHCTCTATGATCEPTCTDGLCGTAAVQAALVGTWYGTVVTPWDTYDMTLAIAADGHYDIACPGQRSGLYYGSDGGGDARRFHVIAQTELGATAVVRVFFGWAEIQDGLARGIRIQGDTLRFDLVRAWLDCSRYGQVELHRVDAL
jgi:hypothetical protein